MPIDLSSKIAVVTGAGSGIGRGLAERLADAGAHVIAADVSEEGLRETAESIGPDRCTIRGTDVSDPASFGALADFVWSTFGRVDVLCNNAGVLGPQGDPLWDVPLEDWHRVLSVNFFGILNGIRAFVPRMVDAASPAHIVNTASMEGFVPGSIVPQYGVSKHAAVALTEILRLQLEARESPIHVAALCPGPVATSIVATEQSRSDNADAGSQDDWGRKAHAASTVRRLTPHEVADDVLDALEHRRPYIFPNDGSRERIEERMERIWAAFP